MIIQTTPPTATPPTPHGARHPFSVQADAARPRTDSVQFSQEAREAHAARWAVNSPALFIGEEQAQMQMGLVRTLMEILFGQKEQTEQTPEKEITEAVWEEPLVQQAMHAITEALGMYDVGGMVTVQSHGQNLGGSASKFPPPTSVRQMIPPGSPQ